MGDIARGVNATGSHMTLRQWGPRWIETHGPAWERSTIAERAETMDIYVLPALGSMRLSDVTRRHVREWRAGLMEQGVTAYRAQRATSILSACFGAAVADDITETNPCAGLKALSWKKTEHDPVPLDELEAIRARMTRSRDRALVSLMAYAGCRPSEAIALQWRDVTKRTVTIRRGAREAGETKTGSIRTVPMIGCLADDLAALKKGAAGDVVLGIFHWNNWRTRIWVPARKAAKVDHPPKMLRHTAASLWIAEGKTSREVAYLMGHSTPRLIERVYGHLFAEAQLNPEKPDIQASAAAARAKAEKKAAAAAGKAAKRAHAESLRPATRRPA
jgi:integrase